MVWGGVGAIRRPRRRDKTTTVGSWLGTRDESGCLQSCRQSSTEPFLGFLWSFSRRPVRAGGLGVGVVAGVASHSQGGGCVCPGVLSLHDGGTWGGVGGQMGAGRAVAFLRWGGPVRAKRVDGHQAAGTRAWFRVRSGGCGPNHGGWLAADQNGRGVRSFVCWCCDVPENDGGVVSVGGWEQAVIWFFLACRRIGGCRRGGPFCATFTQEAQVRMRRAIFPCSRTCRRPSIVGDVRFPTRGDASSFDVFLRSTCGMLSTTPPRALALQSRRLPRPGSRGDAGAGWPLQPIGFAHFVPGIRPVLPGTKPLDLRELGSRKAAT